LRKDRVPVEANMAVAAGGRWVTAVVGRLLSRGGGRTLRGGDWSCVCHRSTYTVLPNDYNCKVDLAITSDGRTIVCYHPSVDIPYEHTKGTTGGELNLIPQKTDDTL
ncbi:hypothetical protein chiPu_0018633, partial [Chiloscyllium punctatum]|nr:hypothetical protein [Chiloscyllium punctatum]